jgi:hypothetical protein
VAVVAIGYEQLGAALRNEGKKMRRCVDMAVDRATRRWLSFLRGEIDRLGVTDTGAYRDGFAIATTAGRATVHNDHPAAGVIEIGCAPHPVSREGQEAIADWCVRKLGLLIEDAERAAYLICRKISKYGQEGHFVVRNAMPTLLEFFEQELNKLLQSEKAA